MTQVNQEFPVKDHVGQHHNLASISRVVISVVVAIILPLVVGRNKYASHFSFIQQGIPAI